ncbi:MAG: recombinase family protein [Thermoguttaceae bacterium]
MGKVYLYIRASDLSQEMSPEQQEDMLRRRCEVLGLEDPIPLPEPLGTSGRLTPFASRPMGQWLLRNAREGDVILATKMNRFGRNMSDIYPVVKEFCARGVGVVVLEYCNGQPLDLRGAASNFLVQMLMASAEFHGNLIAETTREALAHLKRIGRPCNGSIPWGKRLACYDVADHELVGCTLEKDSAGKRRVVVKEGASVPGATFKLEWDEQQLTYMAEIARRTLQDHEPMIHVIQDFHSQRRLDQRGKLFGQRNGRNGTDTAFREARKSFLNAGLAGELPPEWCVIAKELAPPGWTSARRQPKPGDRNYAPWAARKAKQAAKVNGQEEDRSAWSAADWQAWWASEGLTPSLLE